jgi:hypothetical protein
MIDTLKDKMGIDEENANNMSSAIYNFGINLGESVGPIIGGYITNVRSFEASCIVVGFISLTYLLLFLGYHHKNIKEYLEKPPEEIDTHEHVILKSALISKMGSRASSINKEYVGRYRSYSYVSNMSKHHTPKK